MRFKYCLILLFFIPFFTLVAQSDPGFTFFPWAAPFYNPAALGEGEKHLNFTGILRQTNLRMAEIGDITDIEDDQNNGIPNPIDPKENNGKPPRSNQGGQKVLLNIDSYIKKIKGAVGVTFLKNQDAQQDNIGFGIGYAARLPVRRGKLGIGVQVGLLNQSKVGKSGSNNGTGTGLESGTGTGTETGMGTGLGQLNPIDQGDGTLDQFNQMESVLDLNMNFGLHYRTATWYVGVSGTQLLGGIRVSGAETTILTIPRQLYITGGYIWNLKTVVPWSIEPSLIIYTPFSTCSFYAMVIARYNGILWFGASYELTSAISVLLGAVPFYNYPSDYLKGLELGVAFGFETKKFGYVKGGSWGNFELVVRYGFNFYKEKALSGYGSSRHLYKNE